MNFAAFELSALSIFLLPNYGANSIWTSSASEPVGQAAAAAAAAVSNRARLDRINKGQRSSIISKHEATTSHSLCEAGNHQSGLLQQFDIHREFNI